MRQVGGKWDFLLPLESASFSIIPPLSKAPRGLHAPTEATPRSGPGRRVRASVGPLARCLFWVSATPTGYSSSSLGCGGRDADLASSGRRRLWQLKEKQGFRARAGPLDGLGRENQRGNRLPPTAVPLSSRCYKRLLRKHGRGDGSFPRGVRVGVGMGGGGRRRGEDGEDGEGGFLSPRTQREWERSSGKEKPGERRGTMASRGRKTKGALAPGASVRRQVSGLLAPGRGASFRLGSKGNVVLERRPSGDAPRAFPPADAVWPLSCWPARSSQPGAELAGPDPGAGAPADRAGCRERAGVALAPFGQTGGVVQEAVTSMHFRRERGDPGRRRCRPDFPSRAESDARRENRA